MRIKAIACGVFLPYLEHLAALSPHEVVSCVLDAGLHETPGDLRTQLQTEISSAADAGFDAVVLLYGLCGRGAAGITATSIPVVIPRAHDCITLFMGSPEAYLREFRKNPGTFYHTRGWIEQKINPRNRDAAELYRRYDLDEPEAHPDFAGLSERFGEENARQIVSFLERWRKHYSRAAYIDMGIPGEEPCAAFTDSFAGAMGWAHEVIKGDLSLLENLLNGSWDDPRIFVLPPGHRAETSGDDRIFQATAGEQEGLAPGIVNGDVVLEADEGAAEASGIGLGVDAGGTYTDAAVFDMATRKVLAKSKALTTYHDLAEGIRAALEELPPELLTRVHVTALSTTLATNFIVEGRGHKVGLIAMTPFWEYNRGQIAHDPAICVPGYVSMTGDVVEELDEHAAREALRALLERDHCSAIVVAGQATIRNPVLADRVRRMAIESFDVPVICDYEVARRLNWINRAQTAIANARLIPVIHDLLESVRRVLASMEIRGKLLVVKGDGTPVDESVAIERPVETILSGPAASVSGAKVLTGLADALVVDIGGTTTDCAIIEDGHPAVAPDGARVGGRTISVDAVEITTIGLGGDSRIGFDRARAITIGPGRRIPLCSLAPQYATVGDHLRNLNTLNVAESPDASALDVLVLSTEPRRTLDSQESALVSLLRGGPSPAIRAAEALGLASPTLLPLARLEAEGTVKRSGLTPTDLLHVTGEFVRWDRDAAVRALELFSAMVGRPRDEVLQEARKAITRRLFEEIIRREMDWEGHNLDELPASWAPLLSKGFEDDGSSLALRFSLRRPVVAIGAPAELLVSPVAPHLAARIIVPEHAEVANAVGAVASEITAREEVIIRPGESSNYVMHGREERIEFAELARATERAREIARGRAVENARKSGAIAPRVVVRQQDRAGAVAMGGTVFLERRILATASGPSLTRDDL